VGSEVEGRSKGMLAIQVAIYARVSSDQQAEAHTIQSQLAALRERVAADGLKLRGDNEFLDEGYSGTTLVRPALERLRDLVAAGGVDRLYVHSPDRLARKYAYQALLLEEFGRVGVQTIFLNRQLGQTPEDELLLQVQGVVAEYERAKILERTRRGRRHAAQSGSVSVLTCAPYGYRYVTKQEGGGQARFEIEREESGVVGQIFQWVGVERASIAEVCRRLQQGGHFTRSGKVRWDRSTVWGILCNPAYTGMAAFGRSRLGPTRPQLRPNRGSPAQPKRPYSSYEVAQEEWIRIPVPALVPEALFEAVQEQLAHNRQRARQGQRGAKYLLQGLVCCARCGYGYYGVGPHGKSVDGQSVAPSYYRCTGSDPCRFGGQRVCDNGSVRAELLDKAVWEEVRVLLVQPERLREEYQRRLEELSKDPRQAERAAVDAQMRKVRHGIGRLIDSYAEGLIEKSEFEPRITRLKGRLARLEAEAANLAQAAAMESELHLVIGQLEEFAARVNANLDQLDWQTRRGIIRALVKQIEIDKDQVNIVFRVGPSPPIQDSHHRVLLDCWWRAAAALHNLPAPEG
jgi:site-specific DNA recombinase